jgi:ABC-2 type transport system permease protein
MDKILAIIKREYLTRVRSKGFIAGTILSPLLMASFVLIPALIAARQDGSSRSIIVLDQTGSPAIFDRAGEVLAGKIERDDSANKDRSETARQNTIDLRREDIAPARLETSKQELNKEIAEGRLAAYVVVPQDVLESGKLFYHAKNVGDFFLSRRIENAFNTAVLEQRLKREGIRPELVGRLSRDVSMETVNERGEKERGQSFMLAFILMFIIYLTVLVYGIMVMRGVVEEKQSRIIEVLLSSVRPFQLMLGKLCGIGMVGLTQYLIWAVFGIVLSSLTVAQTLASSPFKIPQIPVSLMIFFVVYFLLGYFLYATLYLIVGAIVSNEEDGQQMQMPVTLSFASSMALMSVVLRSPDSLLSTVLSLIPLFSPILMFLRISIQPPPWWQIALSIVLMLGTILSAVWIGAKIYRVGVLMYGKRPTLPELAKWLKYS